MNYVLPAEPGIFNHQLQPIQFQWLQDFQLRPAGAFHRYVLAYVAASAGLTAVYDAQHYQDFLQGVADVFPAEGAEAGARIDLSAVVRDVRAGALPQIQAEQALCCMLANTAFESINRSQRGTLRGNPTFELLRHLRNAASHGNVWHFFKDEPRLAAHWGQLVLDHTRQGAQNPLQGQACFYGNVSPAVLLYVLRDVEQLLP